MLTPFNIFFLLCFQYFHSILRSFGTCYLVHYLFVDVAKSNGGKRERKKVKINFQLKLRVCYVPRIYIYLYFLLFYSQVAECLVKEIYAVMLLNRFFLNSSYFFMLTILLLLNSISFLFKFLFLLHYQSIHLQSREREREQNTEMLFFFKCNVFCHFISINCRKCCE